MVVGQEKEEEFNSRRIVMKAWVKYEEKNEKEVHLLLNLLLKV